jgi:hypothetical protein
MSGGKDIEKRYGVAVSDKVKMPSDLCGWDGGETSTKGHE